MPIIDQHRARIYLLIEQERCRQLAKWGEQNHDLYRWMTILTEEIGEVAKAVNEKQVPQITAELVQSAAVCVAWLEQLFTPEVDL